MKEQYAPDDLSGLYAEAEIDARMRASTWTGSVHADYMGQGFYEMQVELSQLAHHEKWDILVSRIAPGSLIGHCSQPLFFMTGFI